MDHRPRRNRRTEAIRQLVQENRLSAADLVMPLFVIEGENATEPVTSMPGISRFSIDGIVNECRELLKLGVGAVALFPSIADSLKDVKASESVNEEGLYPRCIRTIRQECPQMCVITDVAMDPYSSDGHDGLVQDGQILNDETLPILCDMALVQARAGAHLVAPSDMMDGRVGAIRQALDDEGFTDVGILSYTAKYASSFYGPFREALDSAPKEGDKKTYQMDSANSREALRELALDLSEGADMVMVKPGLPYLDVVRAVSEVSDVPVAVYNVSGEYAMVQHLIQSGAAKERDIIFEVLTGFRRAGADIILTYHAKRAAELLQS